MHKLHSRSLAAMAVALMIAAAPAPAPAQPAGVNATAPAVPNSPQRRAILDALRPAVEAQLGPDVEFVVSEIRVVRGWAFVNADPQRRGGRPIDGHDYFPYFDEMGGLTVTALLRYRYRRWNLVDHAIGATDVWYCDRGPRGLTPSCTME